MTWGPLILAGLWLAAANLLALLPSHNGRRLRAYAFAALGVPILGWLTAEHGPVAGGLALALGAASLRWPLGRPARRARAAAGRQDGALPR